MGDQQLQEILWQARRLLRVPGVPGVTDAQLIDRFLTRRDEAAFELLVWRHGPMVLGVCRRILRDAHDVDDAFQATFLTLARKAGTIGRRQSVGSWLYKVAFRIAVRARGRAARRAALEQPLDPWAEAQASYESQDELAWRELRPLLDAEILKLPEKYRTAFVLCYLEGKTNEQAAAELGCPKGTILSRLARAREQLRTRLTSQGVTLSAGPFLALLSQHTDSLADVSPVLVNTTVQLAGALTLGKTAAGILAASVAELMEEAAKELSPSRWGYAAAVAALLLFVATSAGLSAYTALATPRYLTNPGEGCHVSPPDPADPAPGPTQDP